METFCPRGNIRGPIMPEPILRSSLTPGAKLLYAVLCNYAGEIDHCWPSQAKLAERIGSSVSSVKNYLKELQEQNLIFMENQNFHASKYIMIKPDWVQAPKKATASPSAPVPSVWSVPARKITHSDAPHKTPVCLRVTPSSDAPNSRNAAPASDRIVSGYDKGGMGPVSVGAGIGNFLMELKNQASSALTVSTSDCAPVTTLPLATPDTQTTIQAAIGTPAYIGTETKFGCDKKLTEPTSGYPQPKLGYLNNLNNINKSIKTPLPPKKACTASKDSVKVGGGNFSPDDLFEQFWIAYPRKEAKGLAMFAWRNLARDNQLPGIDALLASLDRFKALSQWQKENGRYIPQPSNWLRGKRWLDSFDDAGTSMTPAEKAKRAEVEEKRKQLQSRKDAEYQAKYDQLTPLFEAFAAKFPDQGFLQKRGKMIRVVWTLWHDKGNAPHASDVTTDSSLKDFMLHWNKKNFGNNHITNIMIGV